MSINNNTNSENLRHNVNVDSRAESALCPTACSCPPESVDNGPLLGLVDFNWLDQEPFPQQTILWGGWEITIRRDKDYVKKDREMQEYLKEHQRTNYLDPDWIKKVRNND